MDLGERRCTIAWLAIALAIVVAIGLRAHGLADHPFWLDEAYSAFAADKGFAFIWNVLPSYETHPPFYSAALRAWTLVAGNSLLGFRSFGLVAGLLTLPVIWLAGRELALLFDRPVVAVALPALLLAAIIPSFVDVARLVRPYYLMTLANACGCWSLLRLARFHREIGRLKTGPWVGYLTSIALLFWLHNLGAFYVAGLGLALLILIGPPVLIRAHPAKFFIGHLTVALAALPAFIILLDQAPTWTNATWLRFDPPTLFDKLLGIYGLPGLFGLVAAIVLVSLGIASASRRAPLAALAIAAATPPLLAIILSLTIAPVFLPRTLVAAAVPFVLLIAAGAALTLLTRAAFAMLLAATLVRVVQIQQLPPEQDWYAAVNWLHPKMRAGDKVYAYPNEGALPLRYALRDLGQTAAVRPIPSEIPARDPVGWYPTGSRGVQSLPPARLGELASDAESRNTPTIWLLRLSKPYYDKDDVFEQTLKRDRREIARYTDRDIEIIGLAQPSTSRQYSDRHARSDKGPRRRSVAPAPVPRSNLRRNAAARSATNSRKTIVGMNAGFDRSCAIC